MNKNQIKGVAKTSAGKVQRAGGKLTGSQKQQVKGIVREAEGKAQKRAGDVQEAIQDARKNLKKKPRR